MKRKATGHGRRYTPAMKAAVLAALQAAPMSVCAAAKAYGVSAAALTKWAKDAGIKLPPKDERQKAGSEQGGILGARAKWGDFEQRRAQAQRLRKAGKTLKQIAAAAGYNHESGAHYAVKPKN